MIGSRIVVSYQLDWLYSTHNTSIICLKIARQDGRHTCVVSRIDLMVLWAVSEKGTARRLALLS